MKFKIGDKVYMRSKYTSEIVGYKIENEKVRYNVKSNQSPIVYIVEEDDMELASMEDSWKDMDYEVTHEPSFPIVLSEMYELYQKKNHDYGDSFSALFKDFGLVYSVPRIYEKATRLKTLLKAKNEVNESVRDTLIDLASYCVMTIVELDKLNKKGEKDGTD